MSAQEIVIGKYTLESLTTGMYSDPFTIYREYIQNATDSIDDAVKQHMLKKEEGIIHITVDKKYRIISIRDNGAGINSQRVYKILGDIGNSEKDYRESRGFRGIGRLGGLGYCEKLIFITKSGDDNKRSTITWDCRKLKELLQPGKYKNYDLLRVIREVTTEDYELENNEDHYFEVKMININPQFEELIDEDKVKYYLSTVTPVPFDHQKFIYAQEIKEYLLSRNKIIEEYNIFLNDSPNPICKMYKKNFRTGQQEKNRRDDSIQDIEFFDAHSSDGKLLYSGWHAITNFYGSVQDEYMRGIRLRKGNILIGDENTFSQFFPVEKDLAHRWFIGEVYIYDDNIILNARRDNFEKTREFNIVSSKLTEKADELNRKYRRGMSEFNSTIKSIDTHKVELEKINNQIDNGCITSDIKKEQLLKKKEEIEKNITNKEVKLKKIINKMDEYDNKKPTAKAYLKESANIKKVIVDLENKIINTDYSTKTDLPSSYSKNERELYQVIIAVIDKNTDKDIAEMLREKIKEELWKRVESNEKYIAC